MFTFSFWTSTFLWRRNAHTIKFTFKSTVESTTQWFLAYSEGCATNPKHLYRPKRKPIPNSSHSFPLPRPLTPSDCVFTEGESGRSAHVCVGIEGSGVIKLIG